MHKNSSILIIRYLQNDLSEDEKDDFYLWINSSATNKNLFFEIKALYETSNLSKLNRNHNYIEESWIRLLNKRKWKKSRYLLWKTVASYVAVMLFTIIATRFFFIFALKEDNIASSHYVGGIGINADAFILPDGSKISFAPRTSFHYNSDYGLSRRDVYLEGEAYFEVNSIKDKPFTVHANGIEVEALGTSFNVMAYPKDSVLITTLSEGSVSIAGKHLSQKTTLKPNQQLIYNRNSYKSQIHNAEASDYASWITGYYCFSNQSLESILDRLQYVYGFTFEIQSKRLKEITFTGTFYKGQSLKEIMEIAKLVSSLSL